MTATATTESHLNDEEIAYWNGPVAGRWAKLQAQIDAQFTPITDALFAKAKVSAGESVLDVGCGFGTTTLLAAERAGSAGRVFGVDVSEGLLELAKRRASAKTEIAFALADASTYAFEPAFDLLISRFGVMFFVEPVAAFNNLRTALKPTGRVAFACWQPLAKNAFFSFATDAISGLAPPQERAAPDAPGPFAFSDPKRVERILTAAGFGSIAITPLETTLRMSAPGRVEDALTFFSNVGPSARMLTSVPDDVRATMIERLRAALAKADGPNGVELGAAVHVVSASAKA